MSSKRSLVINTTIIIAAVRLYEWRRFRQQLTAAPWTKFSNFIVRILYTQNEACIYSLLLFFFQCPLYMNGEVSMCVICRQYVNFFSYLNVHREEIAHAPRVSDVYTTRVLWPAQ